MLHSKKAERDYLSEWLRILFLQYPRQRQKKMEDCAVCLLNCGSAGSETVKNLVLGGIASYTLVDNTIVEERDLGVNFLVSCFLFVELFSFLLNSLWRDFFLILPLESKQIFKPSCLIRPPVCSNVSMISDNYIQVHESDLGKGKASTIAARLQELNSSVAGSFVDESPTDVIYNNPDFFKEFTIVIATQLSLRNLNALDIICRQSDIPLVALQSYGLAGSVRLSLNEHIIVDAKPEESDFDLRLSHPWPGFDSATMNDSTFTHTPFVVLLVQAFLRWRAVNAEDSLQDSGSQQSFKQAIRLLRCTHSEESIKEALGAVRHVWKPLSVPVNVRESLEKLAIKELTANTPKFWFQVAGLRAFLDASGGLLPLRGDIPDMTSSTEAFVAIQRLYREKAAFDASAVHANILDAFRQAGKCEEGYTLTNSTFFCRNAANLRVKEWCSLAEEISWSAGCSDAISNQLAREDTRSCAALYLLLRAVDSFQEKYGRAPGALPEKKILSGNSSVIALEQDVSRLRAILHGILYEIGLNNFGTFDDLISEFVRFGGGELHVVASVVAGICSQEIIKLVTHQFVPLGATLVYDAMSSTTVSIL